MKAGEPHYPREPTSSGARHPSVSLFCQPRIIKARDSIQGIFPCPADNGNSRSEILGRPFSSTHHKSACWPCLQRRNVAAPQTWFSACSKWSPAFPYDVPRRGTPAIGGYIACLLRPIFTAGPLNPIHLSAGQTRRSPACP